MKSFLRFAFRISSLIVVVIAIGCTSTPDDSFQSVDDSGLNTIIQKAEQDFCAFCVGIIR